jgi:hypothetical protein
MEKLFAQLLKNKIMLPEYSILHDVEDDSCYGDMSYDQEMDNLIDDNDDILGLFDY